MIWVTDSSGNLLIDASGQAVPVTDNGGSITVDGTVSISGSVAVTGTVGVSGTVAATQSGAWAVSVTGTPAVDTELPAAVTLTDSVGNPTAPAVGGYLMVWTGAAWCRAPGTTSGLLVQGSVTADTELPAAAALVDNALGPTTPTVGAAALGYQAGIDRWMRLRASPSNGLEVDITRVQGTVAATQSGGWTVDTELPTAGGLTDAMANPVTPLIGACLMLFDGSSWKRVRGDTTSGLLIQGTVTADTELPAAAALADGAANPTTPIVGAADLLFNGTTWDRRPGTQEGTLLASATRNATNDSAVQTNYGAKGVMLTMNLTAAAGTGIKLEVRGIDPIGSNDIVLARFSTNRTGTSQVHWLELHPGAASASVDGWGERFQGCLPRRWKLRVLHSDGNNLTYSVGYTLLP